MGLYDAIPLLQHRALLEAAAAGRPADGPPLHVRLEPTESCNFACRFCVWHDPQRRAAIADHLDATGRRHLPRERLLTLVDELAALGTLALSFTGTGDPLVYPHMAEVLRRSRERGLAVGVTSNLAMPLKEETLDELARCRWVRWSMNGGSEAVYLDIHRPRERAPLNAYRRVQQNVSELVRRIRAARQGTDLNASYVVHERNVGDVYAAARLARDLGVRSIAFRPDTPFERAEAPLRYDAATLDAMQRAHRDFHGTGFSVHLDAQRLEDVSKLNDPSVVCFYSNHTTYIAANGDVYPCCYTRYDRRYVIANILERDFRVFWASPERRGAYRSLVFDRCPSCPHGCVNRLLRDLAAGRTTVDALFVERLPPYGFV